MKKIKTVVKDLADRVEEFFHTPGFDEREAPYLEIGKEYRLFDMPVSSDPVFQEGEETYSGRLSQVDLLARNLTLVEGVKAVVHEELAYGLCFRYKKVYEPFERETIPFSKIFTALEK